MDFLVNELSLHGQYTNERDFKQSFDLLLSCGQQIENQGHSCYYSRELITRKVMLELDLRQVVKNTGDLNFIRQITNLVSKRGPFWSENRQHSEDDYFEYQREIVTDTAIAEVAWRIANQQNCHAVSFKPSRFNCSPLAVEWHQSADVLPIDVQNFWDVATLTTFLKNSLKPPISWEELIQQCIKSYPHLTFANNLLDVLNSEPFSESIAERVKELLSILDELNTCFGKDGKFSSRGQEIKKNSFEKKKAIFTDSSDSEKHDFRDAMIFKKPDSPTGETIFCPFHGKIKMGREYRIHFNWPKEKPTDPLYIVYIGPKITKR
ncbi:MAG: hypothetical protein BWK79_12905 [Beggiatoa sp. IS2]|nr:MAG: hypothetical protein BWK79_12905 [Beggiatoa sp. IS2]